MQKMWTSIGAIALLLSCVDGGVAAAEAPEADREAILSMAGDFEVDFNFEETRTLVEDAEASEPHHSSALEVVRVVEDTGDFISLQHILVVGEGDEQHIVKHWRQDWQYEDQELLQFRGNGVFAPQALSEAEAAGKWSQAVYQVDDSPRYESIGAWRHYGDYSYWQSEETWRPLPRREHTKRDDYDVLVGLNRHVVMPDGWTHEQDNFKLDITNDGGRVLAREHGYNTYDRVEDADVAKAVEYWEETAPFWEAVRAEWAAVFEDEAPFELGETDRGPLYRKLFEMANAYESGELEADPPLREQVAEVIDEVVYPVKAEQQAAR